MRCSQAHCHPATKKEDPNGDPFIKNTLGALKKTQLWQENDAILPL
jgi:hypothetical protein